MEEVIASCGDEIGTASPFESVKVADTKALLMQNAKKEDNKNGNVLQAQEDVAKLKEPLLLAEATKQEAMIKLEEMNNVSVITEEKLESLESESSPTTIEPNGLNETNANNLLLKKVQQFRQRHDAAVVDLEAAKLEAVRLKSQLQGASDPTSGARLVNDVAAAVLEIAKKGEELLSELLISFSSRKETAAEVEGSSEVSLEKDYIDASTLSKEIEGLWKKLASAKKLGAELVASSAMISDVQVGLAAFPEADAGLPSSATEGSENLMKTATDLARSRVAKANAIEVAEATSKELEEAQAKLQELTDENASLPSVLESLKAEVEKAKAQLLALKKKESKSIAATSLNADLEKAKADLSIALSAEAKAKEAITSLTSALQQVTMEANEARIAAAIALEEAQKARLEAEQAIAAISIVEAQLELAVQENEAVKEAEALAVAKLESLKASIGTAPTEILEPSTISLISKEEYNEVLNKKLQDAKDLANKRVVAAKAQIDAVKANEIEIQEKLELTRQEAESNNMSVTDALQRAEKAAAAKTAIEGELQKRRTESKQQQKVAEGVAQSCPVYGTLLDGMLEEKTVQMDSLSQVFQIKIPPIDEKAIHTEQIVLPKKGRKRSISKRLTSLISRK